MYYALLGLMLAVYSAFVYYVLRDNKESWKRKLLQCAVALLALPIITLGTLASVLGAVAENVVGATEWFVGKLDKLLERLFDFFSL